MKKLILTLLKFYKKHISSRIWPNSICRFEPTCSVYTYQAIEKYGILKGVPLGIWRILRCNPFSKGGFDPLK